VALIRTARQAAAWLDRVGLALLFARADSVLPSLWEAVKGDREEAWAVREPDGTFVRWTDELGVVWRLKDELPEQGRACVGKHVGGVTALVAPRVVPLLYALTGRSGAPADFREELDGLELELAEAVLAEGPLTAPQLRRVVGAPKKDVERAAARLQRRLVLTSAGLVEQDAGWGAIALDLLARRWPPGRLPEAAEARRALASLVLESAGELSAADLGGALGWRRRLAAETLDEVATGRDDAAGFRIWTRL
jgi:hypothetical protein